MREMWLKYFSLQPTILWEEEVGSGEEYIMWRLLLLYQFIFWSTLLDEIKFD